MDEKEKRTVTTVRFFEFGGDNRDRTDDLLNAIQALSQLSYIPERWRYHKICRHFCQYEIIVEKSGD